MIASQIAKRQSSGMDAKSLISPDPSQEPPPKLSPPKRDIKQAPKNHLMSHRRALKEMQRKNQENILQQRNKEEQEKQRRDSMKNKHFGNVQPKVFKCDREVSSTSSRSSSSSTIKVAGAVENKCTAIKPRWSISKDSVKTSGRDRAGSAEESFQKHKAFGRVPSYLTERRARIAEAERLRQDKARQDEENRPPIEGMVRLPESERLETLQRLKEDEERTRTELQSLPFAVQSHGTAKKRDELEHRLKEIEEAKSIFSRKKVFVQENK